MEEIHKERPAYWKRISFNTPILSFILIGCIWSIWLPLFECALYTLFHDTQCARSALIALIQFFPMTFCPYPLRFLPRFPGNIYSPAAATHETFTSEFSRNENMKWMIGLVGTTAIQKRKIEGEKCSQKLFRSHVIHELQ